jgi:hypothetical protein
MFANKRPLFDVPKDNTAHHRPAPAYSPILMFFLGTPFVLHQGMLSWHRVAPGVEEHNERRGDEKNKAPLPFLVGRKWTVQVSPHLRPRQRDTSLAHVRHHLHGLTVGESYGVCRMAFIHAQPLMHVTYPCPRRVSPRTAVRRIPKARAIAMLP